MKSILFAPLPEEGNLFPTFALARSLMARGYKVRYLVPADCEDLIRAQGFEFVPLFPDLFPRGLAEAQRRSLQQAGSLKEVLRALRAIAAHSRAFLDRWLDGSADRLLAELAPDMVIAYALKPLFALTAYKAGIPALLVSGVIANARQRGVPPITSPLIPTGTWANRLRIELEWEITLGRRALRQALMTLAGIHEPYERTLRKAAKQAGFPADRVLWDTALPPTLSIPELVICPLALDFPHEEMPERYFVEPSIDLQRSQPDFPWERLDPSKKLIYCALGSQTHRSPATARVLSAGIEAVRTREDWQLVVAASQDPERLDLPEAAPSTVVVKSAPQLKLLERAHLMITHGGTGSLREAIFFGVPMIVMSHMRDHVGNAARIAYHGLGIREDPGKVTAEGLRRAIEQVLADEEMRRRVDAMQQEFRRLEEERPSLKIVERYLRHGGDPVSHGTETPTLTAMRQ